MPDGGLPTGDPDEIARIASALTLQDRATSARTLWKPNDEQVALWRLLCEHRYVLVAKPRKTGISTAVVLDDLLWTNAADDAGNRVRTVFAIDKDDKALEHLQRAHDFATQLGLQVKKNESAGGYRLTFPNGSRLDFVSLGGEEPGRGGDIHRLHITELPYAASPEKAYHALRSACADNAIVIIETTMTSSDAFTVALWRGWRRDEETQRQIPVGTEFTRKFFSVEDQKSYRLAEAEYAERRKKKPDLPPYLTAEQWAYAQKQGFTIKEAAAWWLLEALPNKAQGDLLTLMHDYPQIEEHLFVAEAGRVVTLTPQIATVVERRELHGLSGKTWHLDVYVRPEDCSGAVYITIDTAGGRNKTRSVVLVVDRRSAQILASFCSAVVMYDDLARMAQLARHYYLEVAPSKGRATVTRGADIIVEVNGIGASTAHELAKIGEPHNEMDQVKNYTEHGEDACLKFAKRQIETRVPVLKLDAAGKVARDEKGNPVTTGHEVSVVAGPPELAAECDALKREKGVLVGMKDVLMTYGMALVRRHEEGIRDDGWKKERQSAERVYHEDRMREERMRARALGAPRGLRR